MMLSIRLASMRAARYIAAPKQHHMSTKKKAAVIVTVKKTNRKGNQRYTFSIDKPGKASKETKREYYTRPYTAWRGALRQVGGIKTGQGYECVINNRVYQIKRLDA